MHPRRHLSTLAGALALAASLLGPPAVSAQTPARPAAVASSPPLLRIGAAQGGPALTVSAALAAATHFVVKTTADPSSCSGTALSLRCAISAANQTTATGPLTITFAIPATDHGCAVQTIHGKTVHVCTIQPTQDLPAITVNQLTINGYSQSGAVANTKAIAAGDNAILTVRLDGSKDLSAAQGVLLKGATDVVKGLSVTGFKNSGVGGIVPDGGGDVVEGNFMGLTPAGVAPHGTVVMPRPRWSAVCAVVRAVGAG
jgi:hypothetical protein